MEILKGQIEVLKKVNKEADEKNELLKEKINFKENESKQTYSNMYSNEYKK